MPKNCHNLSEMLNRANDQIIRPRNIPTITGLSRTTVWRLEKDGNFPKRIKLSAGAVGYKLSSVLDWLESRQAA